MKIFLTEFIWDGTRHTGPNIVADTMDHAQLIAEGAGLKVVGELTDIVVSDEGLETLH
jgi:hypothetical protein